MKLNLSYRTIFLALIFLPQLGLSQRESLQDSVNKYIYQAPEEALVFIKKLVKEQETNQNWDSLSINLYNIAYVYQVLDDFDQSEIYLKKSLEIANTYLPENHRMYGFIWSFYGNLAEVKEDYLNAIRYAKRAISVMEKNTESIQLELRYSNLGNILNELGDYEQAISIFKEALNIQKPKTALNKLEIGHKTTLYNNIGYSYYKMQQYKEASEYYEQCKKFCELLDPQEMIFRDSYQYLYNNLALNEQKQGNYTKALYYLQKKLELPHQTEKYRATTYNHIGTTLYKQKKYDLALDTLHVSLKLKEANYPKKHERMSSIHYAIGDVYKAQKKYSKALDSYQSAIIAVVYNFDDKNIDKNPTLDNVVQQVELLEALSAKARTLRLMQKYKASLDVYQLCSQLIDKMRTSFQHNGSKLFFMEKGNTIYEEAIATALILEDKNAAFELAEKSKAMLLLEAMRGIEARFGLPEDLVEKENNLKVDITYYERKIWEEHQKDEPNQDNIRKWKSLIFDLKEKSIVLKEQLERNYPDYYQLQYDSDVISVKEVQRKLLDSRTAMISYFIGENQVYIFTITKKGIEVVSIDKTDNLTDWVENMRLCLQRDKRITNYHATYYTTAFQLYQIFLKPVLKSLPKNIERLIIIPDDQLNFIPFETLLTTNLNLSSPRYELSKVPYLIRDYKISYGYSGTLLQEGLKRRSKKKLKNFGGFVPNFDGGESTRRGCDDVVLGNLTIGRKNIAMIKDIMEGQVHFDDEATMEDFKTLASQYKILHLCTHACAEMDFKDTRIYFSDKELLAFELYNIPLNAQLAVLSACETGIGALKRGEGVMSLARAFMYSGCPSVVTSLWSVDDKSTSEIMQFFYKNLKAGMTKDAALHEAKLDYLDGKGVEESHPYYWSGFVHIGNTEPLFGHEQPNWIWWMGGGIVLGLFGFLYFKSQKRKN